MRHLGIILTVLALAMGGMSMAHTIQLYWKFKLKYLKAHNVVFALLNFQIFAGLMLNYFQFNVKLSQPSTVLHRVFYSYHLMLAVVGIWFIYWVAVMIFELVQWKLVKRWIYIFVMLQSVMVLIQAYFIFFPLRSGGMPVYLFFLLVEIALNQLILLAILVGVIIWSRSLKDPIRKASVLRFVFLMLSLIVIFTVLNSFQVPGKLPLDVYVFIISILFLGINSLPFLFMKGFIRKNFKVLSTESPAGVTPEMLFQQYKISNRETEIIQLICEGKSNREIEEALFISLQTVKDHVYSIYQKTGVKNRVQLVNLFRSS